MFGSMFASLVIAVVFGGLATSDRALAATKNVNCGPGTFTTIQAAVDAAAVGDTIQVCNGTYPEQVTITTSNLTLESQNPLLATIQAPAALPATQQSAIVHVAGARGVTISGFTIRGPGTGSCGTIGYGVLVDGGGSATVANNHITAIRDRSAVARTGKGWSRPQRPEHRRDFPWKRDGNEEHDRRLPEGGDRPPRGRPGEHGFQRHCHRCRPDACDRPERNPDLTWRERHCDRKQGVRQRVSAKDQHRDRDPGHRAGRQRHHLRQQVAPERRQHLRLQREDRQRRHRR